MEDEEEYGIFCSDCGRRIEPGDDFIIVDGEFVCDECANGYRKCSDCGKWFPLEDLECVYERRRGNRRRICRDCLWDGDYVQCSECGGYFESDSVTEIGGDSYCDACRDDCFVQCHDCEEWIPRHDANSIGGEWFCDSCSGEWVECRDCGEAVRYEDSRNYRGEYLCGSCYCDGCYDEECDAEGVMGYHDFGGYEPRRTDGETDRLYLGVELEAERGDFDVSDFSDWTDDGDLVHFEHDGSLDSGGVELITQPCTLRFHEERMNWRGLCDSMTAQGFRSSYTGSHCGLHVHVSRDAVSPLSVMKLDVFVNNASDFLSQIARRKTIYSGSYCPGKKMDMRKAVPYGGHEGRYTPVNTTNSDTVEIRIFKGTLLPETVLGTIELCHAMVTYMPLIPVMRIYEHEKNIRGFIGYMADNVSRYPHVFPMMKRLVTEGVYADRVNAEFAKIEKRNNRKENRKCA